MTGDLTQEQVVAIVLLQNGRVANKWALEECHPRILRLAARIHNLRKLGWVIEEENPKSKLCVYKLVTAGYRP